MSSATACLHVSRASEHEKTFLIPFSGISSPPAQIVLWYFQSLMVTKIDNFYIIQFPSDDQIYCEEEDLIFDRSIVSQSLIQTFGFVCDRLDSSNRDILIELFSLQVVAEDVLQCNLHAGDALRVLPLRLVLRQLRQAQRPHALSSYHFPLRVLWVGLSSINPTLDHQQPILVGFIS